MLKLNGQKEHLFLFVQITHFAMSCCPSKERHLPQPSRRSEKMIGVGEAGCHLFFSSFDICQSAKLGNFPVVLSFCLGRVTISGLL